MAIQKQENAKNIESSKNLLKKESLRKNIKELFADYNGKYKPIDFHWGERAGKEIW